ncbi:MAG: methionyl-tRNA formyltransferase, partial [Gammaproteobacteria bacterium]|nr:methionyl-tRNA formyltransferase [Gammaproteobacteria bacterium]
LRPNKQNNDQATYAAKITKAESLIDWTTPAQTLVRKIRAMNPWPVCYTHHNGNIIKIWQAIAIETNENAPPGTVVECSSEAISIQTGNGILHATVLQRPGGKPLPCKEFINGYTFAVRDRLQNS